jgi:hypothetical protein
MSSVQCLADDDPLQDAIAHLLPWWLFSITLKGTSIEVEDVKVNALRLI